MRRRKNEINRRNAKWYDPVFEKRFSKIARKYIGPFAIGYFIFDFLACFPLLAYEASHGFDTSYDLKWNHIHNKTFEIFVIFKIFKILMLSRISESLTFFEEKTKDIFMQDKIRVENLFGYLRAAGEFLIMIHIFACLWLYIGALEGQWMTDDERLYEEKASMYVDALYFITTTMTSVGYGEISAFGFGY